MVPITVGAGDGTVAFDGDRVALDWNWTTEEAKRSGGPREFRIRDVRSVEWAPSKGLTNGWLRFTLAGTTAAAPAPKYDPHAVELSGFKKDPLMALVAAAVAVRMPHPAAAPSEGTHDVLLRRLRELGELHRAGILTAEEFTTAKAAILGRF